MQRRADEHALSVPSDHLRAVPRAPRRARGPCPSHCTGRSSSGDVRSEDRESEGERARSRFHGQPSMGSRGGVPGSQVSAHPIPERLTRRQETRNRFEPSRSGVLAERGGDWLGDTRQTLDRETRKSFGGEDPVRDFQAARTRDPGDDPARIDTGGAERSERKRIRALSEARSCRLTKAGGHQRGQGERALWARVAARCSRASRRRARLPSLPARRRRGRRRAGRREFPRAW